MKLLSSFSKIVQGLTLTVTGATEIPLDLLNKGVTLLQKGNEKLQRFCDEQIKKENDKQ